MTTLPQACVLISPDLTERSNQSASQGPPTARPKNADALLIGRPINCPVGVVSSRIARNRQAAMHPM